MRFPADRFVSLEDHAAWHAELDAHRQDRALVEASPPLLGSCASCLRATRFDDGRCVCGDRLSAAERALLHAAVAEAGLCAWSRLRLVGVEGRVADRLRALAASVATGEADVAIACDLADGLAAFRRGLAAGGCLLACVAFDPRRRRGEPRGVFGWDVLDQARAAGFVRAEILRPWSRELGYLGGGLFFLKAVVPTCRPEAAAPAPAATAGRGYTASAERWPS